MDEKARRERSWNRAQADRGAGDAERKKVTDTADIRGGETWRHPRGHSGSRRTWLVVAVILAGALLVAFGLTFAPSFLLWIGIFLILAAGVVGTATRVWSDERK
jgi:hypothetical protein